MTEEEWKGLKEGDMIYMFGFVGRRELIKAREVLQVVRDNSSGVPLAIKTVNQDETGEMLHTRYGIELSAVSLIEKRLERFRGTLAGREAELEKIRAEIRRLVKWAQQVMEKTSGH